MVALVLGPEPHAGSGLAKFLLANDKTQGLGVGLGTEDRTQLPEGS